MEQRAVAVVAVAEEAAAVADDAYVAGEAGYGLRAGRAGRSRLLKTKLGVAVTFVGTVTRKLRVILMIFFKETINGQTNYQKAL